MCHLLGSREIDRWQVQLLQSDHDLGAQKLHSYLVDHVEESFIVRFRRFHVEARGAEIFNVAVYWLRIGNAGDPRKQPIQLFGQSGTASQITQSDTAASTKDPREPSSSSRFVRERAESAFTDDCVERRLRDR